MAVSVEELFAVLGWKIETKGLKKFKKLGAETAAGVDGLGKSAKGAGSSLERAGSQGARGFKTARGGLTGLLNGLFLLKETAGAAIGAITDKAGAFATKLIDVTSKTESLRSRLKTAFGEGAAEMERGILKFAAETPFRVDEITDAMIRLHSSGFKVGMDDMRNLGDLAAASGKGFGDMVETLLSANRGMGSMVDNFAGLQGKSKDNKLVLTNLKTGLEEVVEAGDTEALLKFFTAAGKAKGIKGGMAALAATSGGLMSTLQDGIDGFFRAVGDAGFTEAFKELLNLMLVGQGHTKGLATMIGGALATGIRKAIALWPTLQAGLRFLVDNSGAIKAFGSALAFVFNPLVRVAVIGQDLLTFFQGGDSLIGRFIGKLKGMGGEAGALGSNLESFLLGVKAMGEEVAAFFTGGPVGPALQTVRDVAGRALDFIRTNAPAAFAALREAAGPVMQSIAARINQVTPLFTQLWNIIRDLGLPILQAIGIVALPVFKALIMAVGILWTIWSTVWGGIFDLTVGVLGGILTVLEAVAGTVSNVLNDSILPPFETLIGFLDTVLNKLGDIAGVDVGGIGSAISGILGGGSSPQAQSAAVQGASAAALIPSATGGGGGGGVGQQNNNSTVGPVTVNMGSPGAELTPAQIQAAIQGGLGQAGQANVNNLARSAAGGVR